MSRLTGDQLKTLANELYDFVAKSWVSPYDTYMAKQDYAAVANLLNAPGETDNPNPRGQTPVRITWEEFIAILKPGELFALYDIAALVEDIKGYLATNNRAALGTIWQALKTQLSSETVVAVQEKLQEKRDDPDYQPKLPAPSIRETLGLPLVSAKDVQTIDQKLIES